MTLRPYQTAILDQARVLMLQGHSRILIEAPTGSGKTMLTAEMFKGCLKRGKAADFIVHRRELIEQTARTFQRLGIPFGIIAAGQHSGSNELIQLCSIQTLVRAPARKPFMMSIDECHHISAASYQALDADFIFGLSATPITPAGGGLGKWFTHMINGPTIPSLMQDGWLSQYRYFAPSIPDLSDVSCIGGDYNPDQIDKIMRGKTIVGDIVNHWQRTAAGLLTMGFAASISASKAYVEAFKSVGVAAAHIDGTTPKDERRDICTAFCERRVLVLWNVGIAEEGFDVSAYGGSGTVEALINARPTKSLRLARQINGRVMRPKPAPAIINDHAGNFTRHGLPDDIVEWSLTAKKHAVRGGSTVPIQQCKRCDLAFPPAAACPYCGYVAVPQERKMHFTDGQLVEIDRAEAATRAQREEEDRKNLAREVGRARTLDALQEIGRRRGYDPKWATIKFKSRRH